MEVNSDDASRGGNCEPQNPINRNPNPNPRQRSVSKAKSCKGSLYYSSVRKSKSKNPTCVGISGAIQQFPSNTVGEAELEASKRGTTIENFKYVCLGYSIYLDSKNSPADSQNKTPKLPFCVGLEMLMNKGPSTSPVSDVPAPSQKIEEHELAMPQPRSYKAPHFTGEEYLNRFKRNAILVASGVARNLNRVGNYVKETLDDVLNPYRRGPK
ncbi:uncharacterized protein LOC133311368 [Gastrolobium bilobum]|uniref:uncharacterized protein LOC133311368 n=1 Tax=Gastrolobium bilobum TaxID=150636 RepID=UPI002AB0243E|nr:uncharacterized protein LOC133311368 [Gastrolobium bilobum]